MKDYNNKENNLNHPDNCSFIFLPFLYEKNHSFSTGSEIFDQIVGAAGSNGIGQATIKQLDLWEIAEVNVRKYLYSYIQDIAVTDNNDDIRHRRMLMFKPKDLDAELFNAGNIRTNTWLDLVINESWAQNAFPDGFSFKIEDVNLYLFRTGVGIVCFKIRYPENKYDYISSCEFFLQPVGMQSIPGIQTTDHNNPSTLLSLASALVESFFCSLNYTVTNKNCQNSSEYIYYDLFYYSKEGTERADFFTFIYSDDNSNTDTLYKKELYYLCRCYNSTFSYLPEYDDDSYYQASSGIFWGITRKCTACIFDESLEHPNAEFPNLFFENFCDHYRFMYVLMLHQKYTLHLYLSRLAPNEYVPDLDLDTLDKYREQLYEFKTDFVFSDISEVEPYQNLYYKINKQFNLKDLYIDVEEPLHKIAKLQQQELNIEEQRREKIRKEKEAKENERESWKNKLLEGIALLSIFSALVDSYDYIKNLIPVNGSISDYTLCHLAISLAVAIAAVYIWHRKHNK